MSGISGFGGVDRYDSPQLDAEPKADGEAPVEEGRIVRGGSGERPGMQAHAMAEMVADISTTRLQKELQAGGLSKKEAKAEAKEIKKTAEELQELEGELATLKEKEAALLKEQNDPSTDWWAQSWVEYDLADVRWEIAKVEQKLGKLEDTMENLFGRVSKFWDDAFAALERVTTLHDFFRTTGAQKLDQGIALNEKGRADAAARQKKDAAEAEKRGRARRDAMDKGVIRPAPPESKAVRDELQRIYVAMKEGKVQKTEQAVEAMRAKVAQVRDAAE